MKIFSRSLTVVVATTALFASGVSTSNADTPVAHAAAWTVCGAYSTWQEAYDAWVDEGKPRRADLDGDGIPCESLPGAPDVAPQDPNAPDEEPTEPEPTPDPTPAPAPDENAPADGKPVKKCKLPKKVVSISFSATKYPNIKAHTERAIAKGQPKILKLNRKGADERRKKLLQGIPTKPGYDRDEYTPAVGRSTWKADVEYVPSSENRSHGSSLGAKLKQYCDGTKFRYTFY